MAWLIVSYYVDFTAHKTSSCLPFVLRPWRRNKPGWWQHAVRIYSQLRTRSSSPSTSAAAVWWREAYGLRLGAPAFSSLRCRLAELGSYASCPDFSLPGAVGCRIIQQQQQQRGQVHFISRCYVGLVRAVRRVGRFLLLLSRLMRAAAAMLPVVLLYLLSARRNAEDDDAWCSALAAAASRCGPTAVKFGQWASTRRDLFSAKLCDALSTLQRDAWQHDWQHTESVLTARLGPAWREICTLDRTPIGSGCVAQVYKGHLYCDCVGKKAQGEKRCRPVAVKVLHPGIRDAMHDDVSVLRAAARAIEWLVPSTRYLNLTGCMDEFGGCLNDQIDLRLEARNLALFHRKFADRGTVKFAKPIYPFIAADLLIESLEEGVPVTCYIPGVKCVDKDRLPLVFASDDGAVRRLRKQIASAGLHTVLKMIFEDNFVHADLHPGNISIQLWHAKQANNSRFTRWLGKVRSWLGLTYALEGSPYPVLILYDCGIVARLRSEARAHFKDVFTAVVLDQGERVAELFLDHSAVCDCTDVVTFKRQMAELIHRLRGDAVVLGKIRVGELLGDVFSLLSHNRIRLEKDFVSVVVAIAVIEGLGRSLDPDVDLLDAIRHYLVR